MRKLALLAAILLIIACALSCAAYKTQYVFLCVMDGVRYSETFGDPTHANIPHLWNDLRPQAAVYTNYYDNGVTITRQAHSTMATGTWQTCPNGGPRMTMPSIFDYYRDQLGVPQSKTWVIFGKAAYAFLEYSSFPAYADKFKPSCQMGISEANIEGDNKVLAKVEEVMDKDHPSLAYVNFGYTDHAGHVATFDEYKAAVKNVDRIFYDLWQKIQSDSVYKDKTTLILVNDHGRHIDSKGGFKAHGDNCEGCRHIMLAILGPDIKKGVEIDRQTQQIDLAPTIGELLGFQTPLSQGEVLSDCLRGYEHINKKEAATPTMKLAVEQKKLADRDLVKVAADRLAAKLKRTKPDSGFSDIIALQGLQAASQKTGDGSYSKLVTDCANAWPAGNEQDLARIALGIPISERFADPLTTLLSAAESKPDSLTPAVCAAAAKLMNLKPKAESVLLDYVSKNVYTPELAYCVIQAAAAYPRGEALAKESMFASAYMLGLIPECGGVGKDAGESALALYSITQMKKLAWWKNLGVKQPARAAVTLQQALPFTKPELTRLATLLGQPKAKAPRQIFNTAVSQKAKIGLPFSVDLLKYSVDKDGDIKASDPRLAAGAFLLLDSQILGPAKGRVLMTK